MFNDNSLSVVSNAWWTERFRRPLYGSYCFSRIPRTVRRVLGEEVPPGLPDDVFGRLPRQYDTVLFFLIDAFGWQFVERALDRSPLVRHLADQGVLSKLTAQCPSTTAAEVTTLHTGLSVAESGVYAWTYYEPRVGTLISPLPFAFAGMARNSLLNAGISPADILPRQTVYDQLARAGVRSYVLGGSEYSPSPYSQVVYRGAEAVPYRTLSEALVNLLQILDARQGKTYCQLYYDKVDALCHRYGPDSPQVAAEIDTVWAVIEQVFHRAAQGRLKNTLLLISADHGHTAIPPTRTVYLNREVPEIVSCVQTDRLGRPLARAGSPRDHFLHIIPEHLPAVAGRLRDYLRGRADVYTLDTLIQEGLFGEEPPSAEFLSRAGNLVILPYANESSSWWSEPQEPEKQGQVSSHGGLTPQEMDIPLFVYAYA